MQDYPLDIRGLIIRHYYPNEEYRWVAPFLCTEDFEIERINQLTSTSTDLKHLLGVDGSFGELMAIASCIAIRQGQVYLASIFLRIFLGLDAKNDLTHSQAICLVSDEKRKVRRLMNPNREWPKGVWNLQDTPAWIIPSFIKKFRQIVSKAPVKIISGGHLLAPGNWLWEYDERSVIQTKVTVYKL